jgi:hypothetical protein
MHLMQKKREVLCVANDIWRLIIKAGFLFTLHCINHFTFEKKNGILLE